MYLETADSNCKLSTLESFYRQCRNILEIGRRGSFICENGTKEKTNIANRILVDT